ncbi:hypothetical protein [Kutzneria sp. NPDC052558]|uniref:hypothetical protein n=1 Tax=Kutzneria sp. NPDC052558 TaxID=3364121 RepID=UPI0037CA2694
MRKLISRVLIVAAAVGGVAVTTALPASATPCGADHLYYCSGKLPVRQFPAAWISLETVLGSDHHESARGRGHIPENRWLYLDITDPDGTYHGWVNRVKGNGTGSFEFDVVTKYVFDGPGYKVRACTDTAGVFTCTGWH